MNTRSNSHNYAFSIALIGVCSVLFVTRGPGSAHAGESPLVTQPAFHQPQTLDDLFAAVAQQVPEFGGMFLAKNETALRVYLTDVRPRKVAAVKRAIINAFRGEIIPAGRIEPLRGQYGFLQLRKWYSQMAGVILNTSGVTWTDIDETRNRLTIGLTKSSDKRRVQNALKRLNIPGKAVQIVVTGPIIPLTHTVQGSFSPTRGGYQINRIGGGACTLGFNATRAGAAGFVTNSHCTKDWWLLDGAQFSQGGIVGTETADPPGYSGLDLQHGIACPGAQGVTCRYSDSAFVKYDPGVSWAKGLIARLTGLTTSGNSPILTVIHGGTVPDPGADVFPFVGLPSYPYLSGLTLYKVGRTTGWTRGKIDNTCIDQPFGSFIFLCQYTVSDSTSDLVNFGDSGSPVFRIVNPSLLLKPAQLYGILWGAQIPPPQGLPPAHAFRKFIFSPIGGVYFQQTGIQSLKDLGQLDVFADPCLPPFPAC